MKPKIAFNMANLVGRVTNHRFKLSEWGKQHEATAQQTDERQWRQICREIADAGYTAVEVWIAHVDPKTTDEKKARQFARILADHGLAAIAMAGALNDATARVCNWMNVPAAAGGMWGSDLPTVKRLVAETGIRYYYENHPEKSVEEIRSKIEGGSEGIGIAVDTGWLVTQNLNAPVVIKKLGRLVKHVHIKDVKAPGAHETCPLGTGAVDLANVMRVLREMNYQGWYSWEDEPEDRNPMEIARQMREFLEKQIG